MYNQKGTSMERLILLKKTNERRAGRGISKGLYTTFHESRCFSEKLSTRKVAITDKKRYMMDGSVDATLPSANYTGPRFVRDKLTIQAELVIR